MKIEKNKVVAITYILKVEGEVKDQAGKENPLDFIFGQGMLLPKFEANLEGKQPGDKFEFTLTPEEGYGVYDEKSVLDLPKNIFEIDGKFDEEFIKEGARIPMMTNDGRVVPGKVVKIGTDTVKMDFNHEMAGATLNFSGEILTVRDATDKELKEGLHGEFAKSCGGDCSSCGGGCH